MTFGKPFAAVLAAASFIYASAQGPNFQVQAAAPTLHLTLLAKLSSLSRSSVHKGESFDAYTQNFTAQSATATFKRADYTGTAQNGGYGTAPATPTGPGIYRVNLPANLRPGDFKVSLSSSDMKNSTTEVPLRVVYEPNPITVSFVNFKCLDETADSGDSDETYFMAETYHDNGVGVQAFATKVFENTDTGTTKGSPIALFNGDANSLLRTGIMVALADCDNYNFVGDWSTGYYKDSHGADIMQDEWGQMIAGDISTDAYHDWWSGGKYSSQKATMEKIMPYLCSQAKKFCGIVGDELIGAVWLKVSDADIQYLLEHKGTPLNKVIKMTGDGSDYRVTIQLKAKA